jgi:hypothetical protein
MTDWIEKEGVPPAPPKKKRLKKRQISLPLEEEKFTEVQLELPFWRRQKAPPPPPISVRNEKGPEVRHENGE